MLRRWGRLSLGRETDVGDDTQFPDIVSVSHWARTSVIRPSSTVNTSMPETVNTSPVDSMPKRSLR